MTPFRRQPGIVEIEPADHGTDIESRLNRIQLKLGTRYFGAVRDNGSRHNRAEHFFARRIFQGFQTATQGIQEAVICGVISAITADVHIQNIISDVLNDLVVLLMLRGKRC